MIRNPIRWFLLKKLLSPQPCGTQGTVLELLLPGVSVHQSPPRISKGNDAAALSLKQISVTHDDALLSKTLSGISSLQKCGVSGKQFKPEQLARNWGLGLTTARRTIDVTTPCGVRTVLHPTFSR